MTTDSGVYNKNQKQYKALVENLYSEYEKGITLPPEYAYFVKDNLLQLLVRLARYKFVSRMIKKTDTVLEIGCGSGVGSIFLGQHCKQVIGIDVKQTEIDEARSINLRHNVIFKKEDFFRWEGARTYDVVVALDVLEHMNVQQGKKFLAKAAKHLKKDGLFIAGTPSRYSCPYQGKLSKASHVKCYDQAELVAVLDKHFGRTLAFSMNDELVHTGFSKLAWYYFVLGFVPKKR